MMWTIAALLASPAMAHLASPPDLARTARHATILSEACAARNIGLKQETCLLDPESTRGPYAWPTTAIRKDLRVDPSCDENPAYCEGTEFSFDITLVNSSSCLPIEDAAIEVWHCSWDGLYSHYIERSMGDLDTNKTDDTSFLRAIQTTDANGVASFVTSFPGWYLDRTWHIHIRVHFNIVPDADGQGYTGGTTSHIGQLYITDDYIEQFMTIEPYMSSTVPYTSLRTDWIFNGQGGDFGLMDISPADGAASILEGLHGSVQVAILEEEVEAPQGPPGGGNGGPPPNGGNGPNGGEEETGTDTSNTGSANTLAVSTVALFFTAFTAYAL